MPPNSSATFAHMVYFTLKEDSLVSQDALIKACKEYLKDHEGSQYFSVGIRAQAYQRPVNNTDFHVALHLIFATEADHQRYQDSERHQEFIARNKHNWAQVQVFDAIV